MIIFFNNIKRILRNKLSFISMLVPMAFIVFIMLSNLSSSIIVGITDNDKTAFTKYLRDKLSEKCNVVNVNKEEISKQLIDLKINYAVVFDKGFTEGIIKGQDAALKTYKIQETNLTVSTRYYLNDLVDSAKNISKAANGNSNDFYNLLKKYEAGNYTMKQETLGNRKMASTYNSLGFIVLAILLFAGNSTSMIIIDKENKTFFRITTAPVKLWKYMFENILSYIVLSIFQIIAFFFIIIYAFNGNFGASPFNVFILFTALSLVSVSMGVAIASLSKTRRQANVIVTMLTAPMCMLGGCFWSLDMMPAALVKIANFIPTTWVIKGAEKAFFTSSFNAILPYLAVLLLFSAAFFLLGTFKKDDILR